MLISVLKHSLSGKDFFQLTKGTNRVTEWSVPCDNKKRFTFRGLNFSADDFKLISWNVIYWFEIDCIPDIIGDSPTMARSIKTHLLVPPETLVNSLGTELSNLISFNARMWIPNFI